MKKKKVLVGMSGGLDSSVAAALLKEQGYDCIGVYMNLWADPTLFDLEERKKFPQNKCCSIESLMFARSICQNLDIPFYSMNFEDEFKNRVVNYFLEEHKGGETPNPCVRCNKTVKFGLFFEKMKELGCDYLATGHYAKLIEDEEGTVHLYRGKDKAKDQTYFLYNLSQDKLKQVLFPLGDYNKDEVRELAKRYELKELENKKESQGVCFYPEKTYTPFLKRYLKAGEDFSEGDIVNEAGEVLGTHEGLPFYTEGQRKGIKIGGGPALYVNKVDKIKNALIVGNEDALFSKSIALRETNFLSGVEPDMTVSYDVRIRNHGHLAKGRLMKEGDQYRVEFDEPQRAVMRGQSLVLYKDKELIGGGIMTEA
jgi:tRNA-specific 2-thiouridylase